MTFRFTQPDEAESFNLIFDRFEWVVNYVGDSRDTIWYQNCFGNGLDVFKTKVDDLMVTISTCSGPEIKHCNVCAVIIFVVYDLKYHFNR